MLEVKIIKLLFDTMVGSPKIIFFLFWLTLSFIIEKGVTGRNQGREKTCSNLFVCCSQMFATQIALHTGRSY